LPFHQRGDLAASCLKELQHMTKPIFVIVALQKTGPQKTNSSTTEYHYLPAMEAESFVKEIAQAHPQAQAAIAGQLMELAPGFELHECIYGKMSSKTQKVDKTNQVIFTPSEKPFKQVMQGLFTHMEIAMEHNYLHRDIKAENVMINKNDKGEYEVRFIDGGFAAYGGRESKKLELTEGMGTRQYMSPRVVINRIQGRTKLPYGAEVDFYSTGMLLLEMIDPNSLKKVHTTNVTNPTKIVTKLGVFSAQQVTNLSEDPNSTNNYLDVYLKAAGDSSTVSQKLNASTSEKQLINLCFEASKGGKSGEKAFEQWKTAFEQWKTAFEQWKQENSSVLPT
jgi:hypothetical protein